MAKKRKPQPSKATQKASEDTPVVEDAVVVEETPEEVVEDVVAEIEETVEAVEDPVPEEPVETPEPVIDEPEPVADAVQESIEEIAPEHSDSAVIAPQHQDSASNSVFLPAILGGLIAAGLGFGVAYYLIPRADPMLGNTVATNTSAVTELREELAAVAANDTTVDLTPITDEITALRDEITTEFGTINERIADVDERLTTLEKQPSGDGTLQEAAVEAYQRELDELRAKVEDQASAAFTQLEETRAEAAAIEQAALDAAQAAQIRSALAKVQSGLTDGEPMDAALEDLADALGEPVPDALAAVAEGAPTLAGLQASFPEAARSALADARAGGASGEESTAFGAFLREQLNVRSVAPREGDDADAVLSRAQAAVSEGQLQSALDEIGALPDVAKAKLADWATTAEARVAALAAADDISLSLNVN